MDDPFNWGVDRVVRELCFLGDQAGVDIRQTQPSDYFINITVRKSETVDLKSKGDHIYLRNDQPTVVLENSTSLPVNKRKNEETQCQPGAKRPKLAEVIEISDDEPYNINQTSNEQPEPENAVPDSQDDRGTDSEFGGEYANRHITEEEWKSVCRMFHCPESTSKLKPPGLDIKIAAYQLHAVWWMLTQKPLRDI
ncbi:hypothetical protein F4808DRAFT_459637 [Astrocystis sublimbata]|nr:hypothetical protein F4808DRAFT_459637 [Astrocystis sublimbata]